MLRAIKVASAPSAKASGLKGWSILPIGVDFVTLFSSDVGEYCPFVKPYIWLLKTRILISTDLLSRGIDIQQISLVINYELPDISQMSSYIHRIGRSGRFGRKGTAINIVHVKETYKINTIQNMYHTIINELPMNFTI